VGVTCTLWRVSEADVRRLAAQPDQIEVFLFGERVGRQVPAGGGVLGWLKRLSPITIETVPPLSSEPPRTQARGELDLDKAWQGLHFLFTGTAEEGDEPACLLLRGGEDVGDDEIGNGIPRVLRPEQVEQFATFLSQRTAEELSQRYDPERMRALEIYPEVWDDAQNAPGTALNYLLGSFEELRDFVRTAAAERDALVILVS
jgi:hypothetical protein